MTTKLPVDLVLPEILTALQTYPCAVLEAPPGAGKTTHVPPALLEFGPVLVLEPRRIAARLAARRAAFEMKEQVGQTVGYQVRFEDISGPHTRLRFLTEGVLTRRMLSNPTLEGTACVVLDEFHERHLDGDVALALLRRLQKRRPDLKILVMSATLDSPALASFLENCPVIRSEGRLFPTDIRYTSLSAAALETKVRTALENLLSDGLTGDVLIFLPGSAEIRRSMRACEDLAARHNLLSLALHGDLSPEEQDRAVTPASQRKLIFSTNVAESSVTIEGVTAVIDSGLARVARDNPWSGLPTLEVTRISKSSATQRAGRSSRTGPGRVIRLYPQEDFLRRHESETPEIQRRELSGLLLDLHTMSIRTDELRWFDPPPAQALEAGHQLLVRLKAFDRHKQIARIPVHPRLATLVLDGGREGAILAAALSTGERAPGGDALALLEADLSYPARRLGDQLRRYSGTRVDHLSAALLKAFPDRVVRAHTVVLPTGAITLRGHELLLAIDVEQRREHALPLLRAGLAIEPETLVDTFPDRIEERTQVEWNRAAERVESVTALLYEGVVIEESRSGALNSEQAAHLLAIKAREAGLAGFTDAGELDAFLARCQFAARFAELPHPHVEAALETVCAGLRTFAELRQVDFRAALLGQFTAAQRAQLERLAPERIKLPSGRTAKVQYEKDKDPWIASRLQDFFGLRETPRVGGGRVPLVVHLLAPNQRPVQTTTDLAGFWERLYPQVRRELCRRYPKHAWPERV